MYTGAVYEFYIKQDGKKIRIADFYLHNYNYLSAAADKIGQCVEFWDRERRRGFKDIFFVFSGANHFIKTHSMAELTLAELHGDLEYIYLINLVDNTIEILEYNPSTDKFWKADFLTIPKFIKKYQEK